MPRISASLTRPLVLALLGATTALALALPADAQVRLTQDPSFNARVWTLTTPDADGIRYVGGDFTSYKAWRTGVGGVFDATTGAVDTSFPSVSAWPYARTVISDGNGGWYVSGGISNVGGSGVSRVAHINADGSRNTSFSPSVTGGQGVWSMAKVGNTLLIGGDFTGVNGQTRTRLAALDATTGALLSWAPVANGTVWSIAVSGDIAYIGGNMSQLAGQTRNLAGSVRLDGRTGGGTDTCLTSWDNADCLTAWNPNVAGWGVLSIAVDGSRVFLGGNVSSIGGQARGSLGAVDATTGAVESWNPALNSQVEGITVAGGVLYAVGLFTSAGATTRNRAAAFDTTTLALTSWNPDINDDTYSVAVQGSTVYLGGRFTQVGSSVRNHAAAVDLSGQVVAWDPHICDNNNGSQTIVRGIAATATKTYLLGDFPCAGGSKRMHTAAIGTDGILTDWTAAATGPVYAFSRLGSTIYMVGNFLAVNGVARQRAAAVTTAGAVTAWDPNPGGDRPVAVIATPSRIYLGGFFDRLGPGPTFIRGIAAVHPDTGAIDGSFSVGIDGHIRAMALSGDTLYIGGGFNLVGAFDTDPTTPGYEIPGTARVNLAAVNATTGALLPAFQADTSRVVEGLAIDPTRSRVIAGGEFETIGGVTRRRAAALDATTGAVDTTWQPAIGVGHNNEAVVFSIAVDDDVIYLGGNNRMAITEGSTTVASFAAVTPTTGALTTWRPALSGGEQQIRGISASDAAIFIGGSFTSVAGQSRANTAAIGIDGVALEPWPMDPVTTNPLVVTMAGTSSGAVVSNPGGIYCGGSCRYGFGSSQTVTLTAVPAAGSEFGGWSGACSGSTTTCTVAMSAARSAVATFGAPGSGSGGGGGTPGPGSGGSGTGGSGSGDSGTGTDAGTTAPVAAASGSGAAAVVEPTVTVSNRFSIGTPYVLNGSIRLRVGVPGPGTVALRVSRMTVRAGRGASATVVCSMRSRFAAQGARTLSCRLDEVTRTLRTSADVSLRIAVSFAPTGGSRATKTTTLTIPRLAMSAAEGVTG